MSATLRHDIGLGAADALNNYDGGVINAEGNIVNGVMGHSLLALFGAKRAARWGGVSKGRNNVITFACKLPTQMGPTYELLYRSYWLAKDLTRLPPGLLPQAINALTQRSLGTLSRKLCLGMGLTEPVLMGMPNLFENEEMAFMEAIHENPYDLANWSAYADWLQDQKEQDAIVRGRVMAGWLAKKALKVKYGIPLIATPNKWSWLQEE